MAFASSWARMAGLTVLGFSAATLGGGEGTVKAAVTSSAWLSGVSAPRVCPYKARTGRPCLGCGGTRAFGLMARGQWRGALRANILGAFLGLGAWGVVLGAALTLLAGRLAPLTYASGFVVLLSPVVFILTAVFWWISGVPALLP